MKEFAERYCFTHTTSSPHYISSIQRPSRGDGENWEETNFQHRWSRYQATPIPWCGLRPAELFMGRRVRTDVPQIKKYLTPDWPHLKDFREKDKKYKLQQKQYYDQRHRIHTAVELPEGTPVWVSTQSNQSPSTVSQQLESPRSYTLDTQTVL